MKSLMFFASPFIYVLLSSLSLNSLAQSTHEGVYQIEMVVFSRDDSTSKEQHPDTIKLRYPTRLEQFRPAHSEDDPEATLSGEYVKLPAQKRSLSNEIKKLHNSSNFNVLFHESWQQTIGAARHARSLAIQGGAAFGDHFELEGSIQLSVATYLKISTNLWLSQFTQVQDNQDIGSHFELPPLPAPPKTLEELEQEASLDQLFAENTEPTLEHRQDETNTHQPPYVATQVVLMQQHRDMKSGEVHYLDSPRLGVLIKITPVDKP